MTQLLNCQAGELPGFSSIDPQAVVPAVRELIEACRNLRERLLAENRHYTWDNLIAPLEEQEERLDRMFSPVSHLNAVSNTPAIREAYEQSIELLTDYATETGQHQTLYQAYCQVLHNDSTLTDARRKALHDAIQGFEHAGVALDPEPREEFRTISSRLAQLTTTFENNVLDATMAWQYHTTDAGELAGLPDHVLQSAQDKAREKGLSGYVLGLDMPTVIAVLSYADNRALREKVYAAHGTKASDQGPHERCYDNSSNIETILSLRHRQARLLGFNNYAEVSIDEKMAPSVSEVYDFLYQLRDAARGQAKQEFQQLQAFAREQGFGEALKPWDVPYYTEKRKKALFDFSEEEIRPYFPLPRVLDGLFTVLKRLYGIEVAEVSDFDRYHDTVRLFNFYEQGGRLRGRIYMDLFAREHKRGGAWMDECRMRFRRQDGSVQTPIAYVNGNFTPPQEGEVATLTHSDVLTLFHETGHAMQHVLTLVDDLPVSGLRGVEWDAVEMPSQFMENFCWEKEGLQLISAHQQTGEPLPDTVIEKLTASRHFQAAMQMVRQLEFSLLDMELHQDYPLDIQKVIDEVRRHTAVMMPPAYHRFQNSFTHIFGGPYAAGYYSYKWAEVLSSDVFACFEESGTLLNREIGRRFCEQVLEKGGALPAAEAFANFRGREPSIEALLRHSGIRTPRSA